MDFLCHQCSRRLVLFARLYLSRNEKWWTMVFLYAILLVCECSSTYMCFFTSILYLFTASYHFVATWHAVSPSCFIYFILDWFVYYPFIKMQFSLLFSCRAHHNFDEEMKRYGVWESDQGSLSTTENHQDSLASLYRPPYHLMFHGSFEKLHVHVFTL